MKVMKNIFLPIICCFLIGLSSCGTKADQAATALCDCNKPLIEYNEKRKAATDKNDVTALATLMEEREAVVEQAKTCLAEMEKSIGKELMQSKDFEMELLPILEQQCPETLEAYKKANNIE